MSDAAKRCDAWRVKFNTGRIKETLDAQRERMAARYYEATARLCAMETKTKQMLDQCGVHTILYVPYLDFARQLYKLSRRRSISGRSASLAAQVLLDKWAGRGLDRAVLALIRTEVFDISAPAP